MADTLNPRAQSSRQGVFYGYIVVAAAAVILMVAYGARSAFGIFFKPMSNDFGWTRAMTSGAFSLSLVIEGITGIVMGGLNDRVGPRLVLIICGIFIGAGFLLMSVIDGLWQFYLFYGVIIGIGSGGTFIPLVSTVSRWFVKRRTLMTGITVSGIGLGTLTIAPLANWLIMSYDWRRSYIILGILVLVIVTAGAWFLKRDPAQQGTVPYGADTVESESIAAAVTGFTLKEAILTPQFWMVFVILFCFGISAFAFNPHFVPHVTDLGISAGSAASIVSVTGGVSILGSLVLGNVADKIGNARVFAISFAGLALYFIGLLPARELWAFYLVSVVSSFAAGGGGSSESPLVAGLFGLRSHGLIYGVVGTGFTLGAAIGPFLTGYIYDIQHSYNTALVIGAAAGFTGLVVALLIRPVRKKQPGAG